MNVVAIIQARNGSTRLPRKSTQLIVGKTLFEHVVERVQSSQKVNSVMLATTDLAEDDSLYTLCHKIGIQCYRGSANDLVDRYYNAAKMCHADLIVRITADDPFKDPEIIDNGIDIFQKNFSNIDILTNYLPPSYPEGLDLDIFTFKALEKTWREAKKPYEREHLSPFMYENPSLFKHANFESGIKNISHLRWTIDYPSDMEMTQVVYKHLYSPGKIFSWKDILNLLQKNPEIALINNKTERSEGLSKAKKLHEEEMHKNSRIEN